MKLYNEDGKRVPAVEKPEWKTIFDDLSQDMTRQSGDAAQQMKIDQDFENAVCTMEETINKSKIQLKRNRHYKFCKMGDDVKIGDKVVMNDKYYVSDKNRGRVWTVASETWKLCGTMVVLLEGKSGGYAVDGLRPYSPIKVQNAVETQD